MSDARLVDVETKLAYLEDTVETLDAVVAGQRRQIEALESKLATLAQQLATFADGADDDSPPPHY